MRQLERDIIDILLHAGEKELSVKIIARHVYNKYNTLFVPIDREKMYRDVLKALVKNTEPVGSFFQKGEQRGCYRLSDNLWMNRQLAFEFTEYEEVDDTTEVIANEKLLPGLFDGQVEEV